MHFRALRRDIRSWSSDISVSSIAVLKRRLAIESFYSRIKRQGSFLARPLRLRQEGTGLRQTPTTESMFVSKCRRALTLGSSRYGLRSLSLSAILTRVAKEPALTLHGCSSTAGASFGGKSCN